MPVDVEVRPIAMHAFADKIGHPPDRKNVARPVQREGIIVVKAFPGQNFFVDRRKARIVGLERVRG